MPTMPGGELHGQLRDTSDPDKPVNPLRFVGNEGCCTDDSTGLVLMGARYYDPLLGRFITQDPARDGFNWYAYAGNDPVNAIDPTGNRDYRGLDECPWGLGEFLIENATSLLCNAYDASDSWWMNNRISEDWIAPNVTCPGGTVGEGALSWAATKAGIRVGESAAKPVANIAVNRAKGIAFERSALAAKALTKNWTKLVGKADGELIAVVPDSLTSGICEIKSGLYQWLTPQLKAGLSVAADANLPYNLIVPR